MWSLWTSSKENLCNVQGNRIKYYIHDDKIAAYLVYEELISQWFSEEQRGNLHFLFSSAKLDFKASIKSFLANAFLVIDELFPFDVNANTFPSLSFSILRWQHCDLWNFRMNEDLFTNRSSLVIRWDSTQKVQGKVVVSFCILVTWSFPLSCLF